jgi:hypothetical protein
MSRKSRYSVSVVEKLLEQRRLIQEWLAKIERGAPEAMPPHVVEKVRNDYRARLQSVMAELAEHGDTVRQGVDEALQRQEELTRQQTALRDELAEARLRKQVGELDEGRFKEISARSKEALEEIGKNLAAAVRDIERYEEILDLIAQGEKKEEELEEEEEEEKGEAKEEAREEVRPAASAAEATAVAAATSTAAPPKAEASREEPTKPQMDVLDELAFLKAVTTDVKPKPAPESAGPAKAPAPAAVQAGSAAPSPPVAATPPPSPPSPPSPRKSVVFAPKPPASADRFPELDAAPGLITLDESSSTLRPATLKKEGEPRRQEDAREPQEGKALVCKECGTVNLPTEWYCEKCGAELSAL